MKTLYIKPEIQMVLSENMLMASNSWTVDKANNVNDPDGNDHGHIFGPDTDCRFTEGAAQHQVWCRGDEGK